jgi:hypothetical protein
MAAITKNRKKGDHLRMISANLIEIGSAVSEEKILFLIMANTALF